MSATKTFTSSTSTNTSPTNSTFTFPRPISPIKDSLRPNAHPYPIKTTSTALLSRSNSSSSTPHHQHHYVPVTPPASANGGSPKRHGRGHEHRHRYSSSLSSDHLPRPLPVPPSPSDGDPGTIVLDSPERKRGKRSETLPSFAAAPVGQLTLEDLPPNPKVWTPSQLSTYLATALRVKSCETAQLPVALTRDIAGFVRESKMNGRTFLRLDEDDLEGYGVNQLWRTALLSASRNLRQNVLRGQIWGSSADRSQPFSSPPLEEEDEDTTPHRRRRSNSHPNSISKARQSRFFDHKTSNGSSSPPYGNNFVSGYSSASSASSLDDLFASSHRTINPLTASAGSRLSPKSRSERTTYGHGGRYRNGKVKGMVDTFERSASFDEGDEAELSGTRKMLKEIKGMRAGEVEGVRRVRERGRSQSSASESGESVSSGVLSRSASEDGVREAGSPVDLGHIMDEALKDTESEEFVEDKEVKYDVSTVTPAHTGSSSSSTRPLPVPPLHASLRSSPVPSPEVEAEIEQGEEPTIEELLARQAQQDSFALALTPAQTAKLAQYANPRQSISKGTGRIKKRSVGVYAWEDEERDVGEGKAGMVTVKRVPVESLSEVVAPVPVHMSVPMGNGVKDIFEGKGEGEGEVERNGSSRTGTPSSRPLPTPPIHPSLRTFVDLDESGIGADAEAAEQAENESGQNADEESGSEDEEKSLRDSIESTKFVLDAFSKRLGEVESKVDVLEGEVEELLESKVQREKKQRERERGRERAKEEYEKDKDETAVVPLWPVTMMKKILDGLFGDSMSAAAITASEPHSTQVQDLTRSRDNPKRTRGNSFLSLFDPNPQKISQLPPYFILVGLGVCAVVLRVVVKRLGAAGRR